MLGQRLGLCSRDAENARRLGRLTFLWSVSFVAGVLLFGPSDNGLAATSPLLYALLLVPFTAAGLMIHAYLRFVREADEYVRGVLLTAAAQGFGVVFALGIGFALASQVFGAWEDSGAVTWAAGFIVYELSLIAQLRNTDVQPAP